MVSLFASASAACAMACAAQADLPAPSHIVSGDSPRTFAASAGSLDFDVGPRASSTASGVDQEASAGMIARLGEDLRERNGRRPGWYLFAGMGATAVMLDPRNGHRDIEKSAADRSTISRDAQAGLAFDVGGGDLALAYVSRESAIAKDGWGDSRRDGFAVISFNLRQ